MRKLLAPVLAARFPSLSTALSAPLRERALLVARVVWLVIAAATVGVFFASLPANDGVLRTLCSESPCAFGQISSRTAQTLRGLGLSLDSYATVDLVTTLFFACVWLLVAGILFWRRSTELVTLIVSLFLVVGGTFTVLETFATSRSPRQLAAQALGALFFILFSLLASLFPSGRFVPGWTQWLVLAYAVVIVTGAVFFPNPYALPQALSAAIGLVLLCCAVGFGYAQIALSPCVHPTAAPANQSRAVWLYAGPHRGHCRLTPQHSLS